MFSIVTGVSMDYLTDLEQRPSSFKEFTEEWIIDQFLRTLDEFGLKKPWYWDLFLDELDVYHHMVYATAYTYRSTLWFNCVVPGPKERAWLRAKYPKYWDELDAVWERIALQWKTVGPGEDHEASVHSTAMPTFCDLCQLPLSAGTPSKNSASVLSYEGASYIFCSEPCKWIFLREPERYAGHRELVKRVLSGEAPGSMPELLTEYFHLNPATWGKDAFAGHYAWMNEG